MFGGIVRVIDRLLLFLYYLSSATICFVVAISLEWLDGLWF
ncbi:MAG: hypothetical protein ACI8RD_009658, partial [Bacillariaceae sp.]